MLFSAMEEEVREYCRVGGMQVAEEHCRERLMDAVHNNKNVFFHWCMLTAESEETNAQTIFDMLVSMWIIIPGFAFAGAFVEMYKQEKERITTIKGS